MKAAERRKAIVNLLLSSTEAISGGTLSEKFGVSRQIIVQDITVLKGSGYDILSTHIGYIIQKSPLKERVFKLHHTTDQTEDELTTIHGGMTSTQQEQAWADFNNCPGTNGQQDCFCAAGGGGQRDENGDVCACVGYGQGYRGGAKCICPLVGVGADDEI